ncbi:hypothetical protein GCM10010361_62080 [Streptomyces olivaceiscleroticus]|uniref:Uncharacterized protein n=1 Tax=Streptomyces olivaceiscleroticus TaxID=68245 RepID=A0ABN1B1V7_9ACTN
MRGNVGEVPFGPEIWVRGPVVGEGDASSAERQAAPEQQPAPQQFSWVNVHGGAGATTLATLFGGADVGQRWPDPSRGEPATLLLVARTHAAGLTGVSQTLDLFRRGEQPTGLQIGAVVLVADAPGRLPRELQQRIKILGSAVAVHRVPWIAAWRTGAKLDGSIPRELLSLARLVGHSVP